MKLKKKEYMLSASLICSNFIHLQQDLKLLEKSRIDYIHFDVMDGAFVPRYGLFPELITQIRRKSTIPIDIHMMVKNPEKYIDTFVNAGANNPDDIFTIHAESTIHLDRVLNKIHSYEIKAGVALNPATPLQVLDYIIDKVELIMIMGINPGIVGHKLIPQMIDKVKDVKNMIGKREIIIEVDGGVTFSSAPKMLASGASMLVCGTQTIFRPHEAPIDEKIQELRSLLDT